METLLKNIFWKWNFALSIQRPIRNTSLLIWCIYYFAKPFFRNPHRSHFDLTFRHFENRIDPLCFEVNNDCVFRSVVSIDQREIRGLFITSQLMGQMHVSIFPIASLPSLLPAPFLLPPPLPPLLPGGINPSLPLPPLSFVHQSIYQHAYPNETDGRSVTIPSLCAFAYEY